MEATNRTQVAFVGLGVMGYGMACHLLKRNYTVTGYDVVAEALKRFEAEGGAIAASPAVAAKTSIFLICMVPNADQVNDVLFGDQGAASALPQGATVLLCSTIPAATVRQIQLRLRGIDRDDLRLVDCPVSGGTARAAEGCLTILAAGDADALEAAKNILSSMSRELFVIQGGLGAASNVKMINQLLVGTQIVSAAEAMGLAACAGLNTRQVYEIMAHLEGHSWAFGNRVPHMLDNDWRPLSALDIFVKDMGIVTSTARSVGFPVPLASVVHQLYLTGAAAGYGREHDAGILRVYLPRSLDAVHRAAIPAANVPGPQFAIKKIGFVGLDDVGQSMASSLLAAGYAVCAYDKEPAAIKQFLSQGAAASNAHSPSSAANGAQVLILRACDRMEIDEILFGAGKVAEALNLEATVILSSTLAPSFVRSVASRLAAVGNISVVDAPVVEGVARATKEELKILYSGDDQVLGDISPVLAAIAKSSENVLWVQGSAGSASTLNLINRLLAGVHIATTAEAMAFASKVGLKTSQLYEIINTAAGWSSIFERRVPQMLASVYRLQAPRSALQILVKDLGIVMDLAKDLSYPTHLGAATHQLYLLAGANSQWLHESAAGIVRVWESMTGVSVSRSADMSIPQTFTFSPRSYPSLPAKDTLDALPTVNRRDVVGSIREHVNLPETPVLVVLDDDPTGTQTCHDIAVLTVWDHNTLCTEFRTNATGFFILTNSRALPGLEAKQLIETITRNVAAAASETGKSFEIVLRGDSTLRGHLPEEPEAVENVLGKSDGWILAPFFFQGGRYTIDDVHYVREGDVLVPASETAFAKDATFGYRSSNLRDYIREKCGAERFTETDFCSVTIEDIRIGGPERVRDKLLETPKGGVVIVNAAAEEDMFIFAAGLLLADEKGKRFLFRTGAAFVSSRLGIEGIEPLTMQDLGVAIGKNQPGGLIVAGSYVPKTTAQLQRLRERRGQALHTIELDVERLIGRTEEADNLIKSAVEDAAENIKSGKDVLVMTSRELITGKDALSSLEIGGRVASALVRIVEDLQVRPRYIIAKGGITSSDAASKGLKMKRAMILGQAAKGVPLWQCDEPTSRHTGVPYVVFPGNVGTEDTVAEVVERWAAH